MHRALLSPRSLRELRTCDPAAACLLIAAAGSATNVSAANPEGQRVLLLGAHVLTVGRWVMKSSNCSSKLDKDVHM